MPSPPQIVHFIWPNAGLAICEADVKHGAGRYSMNAKETTCRACLVGLARCGEWPGAIARARHLYGRAGQENGH